MILQKGVLRNVQKLYQLVRLPVQQPSLRLIHLLPTETTVKVPATNPRNASITNSMASDEDYMAFLNKANRDTDEANAAAAATSGTRAAFKAQDTGEQAPAVIQEACKDAFYVSDADEPFQQVSLQYQGTDGLPDEVEFAKLIHHWDADNADVSIMDPMDWDAKGQYTKLIEAVRSASKGNDVRVYKVTRDATRAEYWVITAIDGRILGVKALAIES